MNHAGEISTLVRVAEPDARVWTNVGEAHVGFFGSIDAIADAKAEDSRARDTRRPFSSPNADDDPRISRADQSRSRARVGRLASNATLTSRATAVIDRGIDGTDARVTTPQGAVAVTTPLVGRGNLANVLAGDRGGASSSSVPLPTIASTVSSLRPAVHRGEVLRLGSGVIVIDDSYNASPTAMRRALDVLGGDDGAAAQSRCSAKCSNWAIAPVDLHADARPRGRGRRVDALFAVGGTAAEALVSAAVAAATSIAIARDCSPISDRSRGAAVAALVQSGDVVLVKGSRGVKTDRVVDRLQAERA